MGEITVRGQIGPMHLRLLLAQHFLLFAADFMLRCGLRRGSGRSNTPCRSENSIIARQVAKLIDLVKVEIGYADIAAV
jgi:hypothetical protein